MESTFVHPYSAGQDVVEPTANPNIRPYLPYHYNGDISYYGQVPNNNKDVNNKEIRPDVWQVVEKNVPAVAYGGRPKEAPVERTWDEGPKPKDPPAKPKVWSKKDDDDEELKLTKKKETAAENKLKGVEEKKQNEADIEA